MHLVLVLVLVCLFCSSNATRVAAAYYLGTFALLIGRTGTNSRLTQAPIGFNYRLPFVNSWYTLTIRPNRIARSNRTVHIF